MNAAHALSFVVAFAVSLAFSASACSAPDCDCPEAPISPTPEGPFTNAEYIFGVSKAPSPLQGSVEITGSELVITYENDGPKREIRYAVEPN